MSTFHELNTKFGYVRLMKSLKFGVGPKLVTYSLVGPTAPFQAPLSKCNL